VGALDVPHIALLPWHLQPLGSDVSGNHCSPTHWKCYSTDGPHLYVVDAAVHASAAFEAVVAFAIADVADVADVAAAAAAAAAAAVAAAAAAAAAAVDVAGLAVVA